MAIAVGLRTAATAALEGIEETSVQALTKVIQVMPPRLRRRVDALKTEVAAPPARGPTVHANTLTAIAQACRDDERLRFRYTRRDGEQAVRLVEPHRLVSLGRRWYLVAWDLERHDWRTFRVDRLTEPATTGARFRQRELPGGDAAAFVRGQLASIPTKYQIVVRVSAPAAAVARVVAQWGTVEPAGDGSSLLRMSVDELEWPAMVLGAVGADFEVIEPVELRDHLRSVGELFLRGTAAGTA